MDDLFTYADELKALGRTDALLAEYTDLIDANLGGIEPYMRRADMLRDLGRPDEAEGDLRAAAVLEPHNGWPVFRLAQWAHHRGKHCLAVPLIEEALRREPAVFEFQINAAAIFTAMDWRDRAFRVCQAVDPDLDSWWGAMRRDSEADYRMLRGEARARLRHRRDVPPLRLAESLFRIGRIATARRLCEALMRDDPHAFAPFELRSRIVARDEGAPAALVFLRVVGFLHDGNPDYLRTIAVLKSQLEP